MKIQEISENGIWWRVDYYAGKKRHRPKFKTRAEAEAFADKTAQQIRAQGADFLNIPQRHRAEMLVAWTRARELNYSLLTACSHYEQTALVGIVKELSAAVDEFLKAKAARGLRPRSLLALHSTLRRFELRHGQLACKDLRGQHISDWLQSLKVAARTRNGYQTNLSGFCNWCVMRGYMSTNPTAMVERPISDAAKKGILSPEQAREVLRFTASKQKTLLPYITLGMFGGLRAEAECRRLAPEKIRRKRKLIEISADKTKTRRRRFVPIAPNLDAWLELSEGDPLPVVNADRKFKALRRGLSFDWPPNCLRHSFCSYHLADSNNAALTARIAGHSEQVLFNNYAELVTPEQAADWWAIVPESTL
jgi:site-specific recombinase XerC